MGVQHDIGVQQGTQHLTVAALTITHIDISQRNIADLHQSWGAHDLLCSPGAAADPSHGTPHKPGRTTVVKSTALP